MSENVPDSFDPQQPDLPTLAVDPDPETNPGDGQDTRHFPTAFTEDDYTTDEDEDQR